MKGNPLYILLWLSLILCFACSPGKKEKKYVIGVSQCSMTDIWRQSMIRDMEVEALNHPEIELVVMDASQDNDTQISQIKGFIKKKVDLLIISSNETEPVTPVAVEAYRAGIFPLSYWTGKLIAMNIRRILERIITRSVVRSECTSAP